MATHRFLPTNRITDRYRVEEMIGEGSMGTVYRVLDLQTRQFNALKVMRAELAEEAEFNERFVREAMIGKSITCRYVVRVLASGVEPKYQLPYLVMELLDGMPLSDWVAATSPPPDTARKFIGQLLEALDEAHRSNIVHRDLKPENLFAHLNTGTPELRVLDFGVAKVVRESTLGATAAGLGTPMWVAPEQGNEGIKIRPNADVWAIGLLAFWLTTGKQFWLGANGAQHSTYELALEVLRRPIPLASARAAELGVAAKLPKGFDAWFKRCVDREPEVRFVNAGEARRAYQELFRPMRTIAILVALICALVLGVILAAR